MQEEWERSTSEDSGFESRAGLSCNELSCWPNGKASDYGIYISFTFLHKLCHIWHNLWSTLEILLSYSHAHPVKTPTIYSIFYVLKEETHYTILYYFIMKAYTLLIDTKLHVSSVQYTKWNTESNNTILPEGISTHTTVPVIYVLLFM